MLLVGIGVLSRLFRHDLAGRVATLNLTGGAVGSASASSTAVALTDNRPIQGPPAPGAAAGARTRAGISAPLAARGTINGRPYQGTHSLGNWQSDNAIDIAVPIGTAVLAPENGTVVKVSGAWAGGASRFDGYGVTIRGVDGNEWFLKHLSRTSVRAGQAVVAGQVIGASGAANSNAHLHLGQLRGNPLDTFGYR